MTIEPNASVDAVIIVYCDCGPRPRTIAVWKRVTSGEMATWARWFGGRRTTKADRDKLTDRLTAAAEAGRPWLRCPACRYDLRIPAAAMSTALDRAWDGGLHKVSLRVLARIYSIVK